MSEKNPYYTPGAPPPTGMYPSAYPPAYSNDCAPAYPPPSAPYHQPVPGPQYYPPPNQPQYPPYSTTQGVTVANKKGGFLSSLANDLGRGADSLARSIENQAGKLTVGDVIGGSLASGNVIQLKTTKHQALEVVLNQHGQLVVDGQGPLSPQAYHAHWTVLKEYNSDIVKLYNRDNYLGVMNSQLTLIQAKDPMSAPMNTRFRARQSDKMVSFESMASPAHYIHVDSKTAQVTLKEISTLSRDSYFTVLVVYLNRR